MKRMQPIYETINTFSDDIYKSDLREKILNPMIVQHNHMALDLINNGQRLDVLEAGAGEGGECVGTFAELKDVPPYEANRFLKVNTAGELTWGDITASGDEDRFVTLEEGHADQESRIVALESNGTGGSVDAYTKAESDAKFEEKGVAYTKEESDGKYALKGSTGGGSYDDTAIVAAVDAVEADVVAVKADVADHETRIAGLEVTGGNGTVDLSPVTDRLDVVEADVADHETRITAVETSGGAGGSSTFEDLTDIPSFVSGSFFGISYEGAPEFFPPAHASAQIMSQHIMYPVNPLQTGATAEGIKNNTVNNIDTDRASIDLPQVSTMQDQVIRYITSQRGVNVTINVFAGDKIWTPLDGNATSINIKQGECLALVPYKDYDGWLILFHTPSVGAYSGR